MDHWETDAFVLPFHSGRGGPGCEGFEQQGRISPWDHCNLHLNVGMKIVESIESQQQ